MSVVSDATIPVSPATRDKIKRAKRGGETYDHLLRKMLAGYDPDDPEPADASTASGAD